jgi:hypothetical protein
MKLDQLAEHKISEYEHASLLKLDLIGEESELLRVRPFSKKVVQSDLRDLDYFLIQDPLRGPPFRKLIL